MADDHDHELILTKLDNIASQVDDGDVRRVQMVIDYIRIMREQLCSKAAAIEQVPGLTKMDLSRWRRQRPHVMLLATQLALSEMDESIEPEAIAAWTEVVRPQIRDTGCYQSLAVP